MRKAGLIEDVRRSTPRLLAALRQRLDLDRALRIEAAMMALVTVHRELIGNGVELVDGNGTAALGAGDDAALKDSLLMVALIV
jgi:hypothetical protein